MMLTKSAASGNPGLIPDLEEEASPFSPSCMMLAVGFICGLCHVEEVPFCAQFIDFFFLNHERAAYFLKCYALEMLKEKCYNLLAPGKKEVLAGAK